MHPYYHGIFSGALVASLVFSDVIRLQTKKLNEAHREIKILKMGGEMFQGIINDVDDYLDENDPEGREAFHEMVNERVAFFQVAHRAVV